MPIILDNIQKDLDNAAQMALAKTFTPKFFDKKLTGSGGSSRGFLADRNNPPATPKARITTASYHHISKPKTATNGNTTVIQIPVHPIHPDVRDQMKTRKIPDLSTIKPIAEYTYNGDTVKVYPEMKATAFTIEETVTTNFYTNVTSKSSVFVPAYELTLWYIPDGNQQDRAHMSSNPPSANHYSFTKDPMYSRHMTANPIKDWNDDISAKLVKSNWNVDHKAFMDYMMVFEAYDAACDRSEEWQDKMHDIIEDLLESIKNDILPSNAKVAKQLAMRQMRYIMNYNIPLDLYKSIYQSVTSKFQPQDAKEICKQNLNLLLSDTLESLDANKGTLITFKQPDPAIPLPASVSFLSKEQRDAVMSNEPLILVQAGAGTGKSSTILARIDYLTACGVTPADITVLSFTNAAADHITAKNSQVHSMTIARMIHEIYTENFKDHELSQLDTLINSLEIYFPKDMKNPSSVEYQFGRRMNALAKNDTNAFTDMNNFIEDNYDEVIRILNVIRQTSLELEIIICYQQIGTFTEPASIQSRFLIIDEVQDNSIFEFIYALKYVDKHKESLYIVGKPLQMPT